MLNKFDFFVLRLPSAKALFRFSGWVDAIFSLCPSPMLSYRHPIAYNHSPPPPPPPPRSCHLVRCGDFFPSLCPSSLQLLLGKAGRFLFFLVAAGFLSAVLTACAGGDGSSGSGTPPSEDGVHLTFAPIENGFRIANQSSFGDFTSLNITATSGNLSISRAVPIAAFSGNGYEFTGLADRDWKFAIIGISDGGEQEVNIVFVWQDNRQDHASGGIRSGNNTDGDSRADSVDTDDDNDGINDEPDRCPTGEINWTSNPSNDNDRDGCRDSDEDDDDDNDNLLDSMDTGTVNGRECRLYEDCDDDGVNDDSDQCRTSMISWTSNPSNDNDGDGCRDTDEDNDDDNDRLDDDHEREQLSVGGRSCSLLADCDGDSVRDINEVAANCVIEADCDSDTFMDGTDIDDDGDGLIEIATAAHLDAVRHQLDSTGRKLSASATLNQTGCGDGVDITSCSGYELVADISLAAYANADGGKGWQPLGHDTNDATSACQGDAFDGTFEGNDWTISDLSINRPREDCVGLFGYIAASATIRNLTLRAETVIGKDAIGSLVGDGQSAQIHSSSVVVGEVRGRETVGGLVGWGQSAQIVSSSVVVGQVSASRDVVGGLVGWGQEARVFSSSVVVGELSGGNRVGGLMGFGQSAMIHYSSVVASQMSGRGSSTGGLVGFGQSAMIYSSSVVAGEIVGRASSDVGGLVGKGQSARIYSSSVVTAKVGGNNNIGGLIGLGVSAQIYSSSVVVAEVAGVGGALAGDFNSESRVAYSYVVPSSQAAALVGPEGETGIGAASYWYNDTMSFAGGNHGEAKTSDEIRSPTGYAGTIYATWDDDLVVFDNGTMRDVPLAVWCDEDHSGSIETDERTNGNLIWDFGTSSQYPAISCTPIPPADWRSWWSLDGDGEPQLNQTRLDQLLP